MDFFLVTLFLPLMLEHSAEIVLNLVSVALTVQLLKPGSPRQSLTNHIPTFFVILKPINCQVQNNEIQTSFLVKLRISKVQC